MRAAAAFVLVALLAGCLQSQAPHSATGSSPESSSSTPATTTTSGHPSQPGNGSQLAGIAPLRLDDCHGLSSDYNWAWRNTTYAPTGPPGWGTSPSTIFDVYVDTWECSRLSWGRFERPIQFVVEYQNNLNPPSTCDFEHPWNEFDVVSSIWFNDPEVAAYARDVAGLPVRDGTIAMSKNQDAAGIVTATATWGVSGQQSTIQDTYPLLPAMNGYAPGLYLHWWYTNGTLTRMAWVSDGTGQQDGLSDGVQTGTMQDPMIVSHAPSNQWVGKGEYYFHEGVSANFTRYSDTMCQHPIP